MTRPPRGPGTGASLGGSPDQGPGASFGQRPDGRPGPSLGQIPRASSGQRPGPGPEWRAGVGPLPGIGLTCFCAGGLYGWSALIAPLETAFGVSTGRSGLVFSLAIASFTLAVLFSPAVVPHARPGRRVACFGVMAALCLLAAAQAPGFGLFALLFGVGFGGLSGAIYSTAVTAAAQSAAFGWATPVMVAAFGLGGAVFGPLWRGMAAAGWGLWALGPLAAALAIAAAVSWVGAGPRAGPAQPAALQERPVSGARTVPVGTLSGIWLIFAFGAFGGMMVLGLAAKILETQGATLALSAAALTFVAAGNTSGRLSLAALPEAMSPLAAVFASVGAGLAGLVLALVSPAAEGVAAGLVLVALGYGIMASAVPALVRARVGAQGFAAAFPRVFTAWGLAGFCAPWAGGALFDATGSFDAALWTALVATGLSGAVAGWLALRSLSPGS